VRHKLLLVLFFSCFFSISAQNSNSQEVKKDSTTTNTPFKKGRWLVGLSGSIGSASTENTTSNEITTSNRYSIAMGAGKFVMDRLNVGLFTDMERQNSQNDLDEGKTVENFFIGPNINYYISKSEIGSLYAGFSPGFTRYRTQTIISEESIAINTINTGNGFGMITTFGFMYVINNRVGLDISLNWNNYWININQETLDSNTIERINFVISDLTFAFGFKILLDKQSN
jgi:outer membrane protein W